MPMPGRASSSAAEPGRLATMAFKAWSLKTRNGGRPRRLASAIRQERSFSSMADAAAGGAGPGCGGGAELGFGGGAELGFGAGVGAGFGGRADGAGLSASGRADAAGADGAAAAARLPAGWRFFRPFGDVPAG